MANSLTAFNPSYWASKMQGKFYKENVALALANTELRDELPNGTKIYKPYRGSMIDQSYSKGVAISVFNDLTATEEYGEVDTTRLVPFYVDDLDKMQNKWDTAAIHAQDAQKILNDRIEQAVIASGVAGANQYISAQDLAGNGTGAATLSTANVTNMFAVAHRKLTHRNIPTSNLFALVSGRIMEILRVSVAGRETGFGDTVGDNGLVAKRFGFDIYQSNNIPFTATLTSSSIPVADETLTVDGVVWIWAASGGANAAGKVSIGANEAAAYANMVLAVNGAGTPGASTYIDVAADDRETLRLGNITASYASNVLTVSGYGDVVISETTTNLAVTTNVQNPLFGMKGATDLLMRKSPTVEFRTPEYLLGKRVYAWTNYGVKTFTQMKKALVYAKINAASWVY